MKTLLGVLPVRATLQNQQRPGHGRGHFGHLIKCQKFLYRLRFVSQAVTASLVAASRKEQRPVAASPGWVWGCLHGIGHLKQE